MPITEQEMINFLSGIPVTDEDLRLRLRAEMQDPNSPLSREIAETARIGAMMCRDDWSWIDWDLMMKESLESLMQDDVEDDPHRHFVQETLKQRPSDN